MFHLHFGNDLRGLAGRLGARIAGSGGDPLTPELVLVPQAGMRRWLEIELAESTGIIANVDFRLPGEFIQSLLRTHAPGPSSASAFDSDILRWRLLPLLAQLAREPVGAPVAHYLRGESGQVRRLQLAREFAAALERYQAYRRGVLLEWEAGASPDDWQAEAWRRLVRGSREPHRARLIETFLSRHAKGGAAPAGLPGRLAVFGCIGISPDVLRVLGVLALHCEVDFYLPSPCVEYWGEERTPRERLRAGGSPLDAPVQPLLAAWGRVGRELFEQIFAYDEVQPADEEACVREPSCMTLLGRVQGDILHLRTPDTAMRLARLAEDDVSLRAHECHSPLREVQVLHDQLLALFERDATLKPRDVAVMLPDVAAYAPVVDAVFGALASGDRRHIPYTISDRSAGDEHPLVGLFLSLLDLPTSRWGMGELFDLFAVPAVMRRHGLDQDALDRLRHWFEQAGVRWGLDAGTRVAFGAGDYRAFTWEEGIERLLLGYATGNDIEAAGIVPVPVVEGSAATALGQALQVVRELEQLARAQRNPRPAAAWQALYQRTLDALLPETGLDQGERRARALVSGALASLAEGAAAGGCDEPLEWQCVREFLGERLAESDPRQRFLAGGVSFCGMVPLRAIPFRVIALLGMDDAVFPRREPANGINRLEQDLRHARLPGDRSVRDDDRYLFLQILTSAEDALHVSWVGRDARTGTQREPSVLVTELLRVVRRDYLADDAGLVAAHPLQPFARAIFDGSRPGVFTYRDEWRSAAASGRSAGTRPFVGPQAIAAPSDGQRLALHELVRFWRNPARAFLHGVLHLQLGGDAGPAVDDDPLVLDGLSRSVLARALVDHALAATTTLPEAPDAAARMRHQLPVGVAGLEAWQSVVQCAAPIAARIAAWRARSERLPPVAFELALPGGAVLDCVLAEPYREGLLYWSPSRLHGNHWLQPWIEHLALCAWPDRERAGVRREPGCIRIGWSEGGTEAIELPAIAPDVALDELALLLQGWREGQTTPLPFFPRASWAYASAVASNPHAQSDGHAVHKARTEYANDRGYAEGSDAWVALAFRDRDPFEDGEPVARFRQQALRVFGTLAGLVQAREG